MFSYWRDCYDRPQRQRRKIIAIPFGDPQYNCYTDISQLPPHIFAELTHFLKVYKELENKQVHVDYQGNSQDAKAIIEECMHAYNEKFCK